MKNRIAVLSLFFFIIIALPPAPARADMAPPPIPLIGGLDTIQYQSTNVQMVSERVEMELGTYPFVDGKNTSYRRSVTVNAWFVMHNTGSQDETMQAVFPLEDLNFYCLHQPPGVMPSYTHLDIASGTFTVQVNGKPVETTKLASQRPHTKEDCGEEDLKIKWAAFNVTFPADEDVLVRVTYQIDNGMSGDTTFGDETFNVGYVLETGAGWKGPIGEATVVFRFPIVVDDFILSGTTPGYRVMGNEIYWQYRDLEPTRKDNISVAFIEPGVWRTIQESRRRIQANPKDDAAWAKLAESYADIALWHGGELRSSAYLKRAFDTYQEGIKANPTSAALNAGYAELYYLDCCFRKDFSGTPAEVLKPYVATALKADPSNEKALILLQELPDLGITPGPTFTATSGPDLTATPLPTSDQPTATHEPETAAPNVRKPSPTITRTATAQPPTEQPSPAVTVQAASVTPVAVAAVEATRAETPQTSQPGVVWIIAVLGAIGVTVAVFFVGRALRGKK